MCFCSVAFRVRTRRTRTPSAAVFFAVVVVVVVTRRQRQVVVVHDFVSAASAAAAGVEAAAVVDVHDAAAYHAGGHGVFPQRGEVPRRSVREEGLPLRRRLRLSRPQ